MFCVLAPPMFAHNLGAIGDEGQLFRRLLCKTAISELSFMSFVCFVRGAKCGVLPRTLIVSDLFLPNQHLSLREEGRLCPNQRARIPL